MKLERIVKPIRLRPHHIDMLFWDYSLRDNEDIRQQLLTDGYEHSAVENILSIKDRIFQHNEPIILVPSRDDICRNCSKWRKGKGLKKACFGKDSVSWVKEVKEKYGMGFGKRYLPLDLLSRMIGLYEEGLKRPRKMSARQRRFYELELRRYTPLYIALSQVKREDEARKAYRKLAAEAKR